MQPGPHCRIDQHAGGFALLEDQAVSKNLDALRRARRVALLWQVFVPNAAVLIVAGVVLTLSPATVSSPVAWPEVIVITAGLLVMLVLNLALIRRAVGPLENLTRAMREIDPLSPGKRVALDSQSAEVAELAEVFNTMIMRLETERRDSALRMLAAQEGERRRVARELHDEVNQSLTALMLQIREAAGEAPGDIAERLRETQEEMRALSSDVQEIVRRLRPEALDDLGLTSALAVLINRFAERTGVNTSGRLQHDLPSLPIEAELVVYRVTQEALTNVARHSGARAVDVELAAEAGSLSLRVTDRGRGLDGATPGTGIRGMRERALLIGGTLRIGPAAQGGTEVQLEVPLRGADG
jgi:two-component system sensor histidine kinase UhpB